MELALAALAALGLYYFFSSKSVGDTLSGQKGWVPMTNPSPLSAAQLAPYMPVGTGVLFALQHVHPSGTAITSPAVLANGTVTSVQETGGKRYWKVKLTNLTYVDKLPDGSPFALPSGLELPVIGTEFALTDQNLFGSNPFTWFKV